MLLKKDTYIKTASELVSVGRFRCCLTTVNIGIILLILLIAMTVYFGLLLESNKLYLDGNISTIVFQVGCLLAWAWTLIRLYKDIEHSDKLLPNKFIFKLHGYLITAYLFLYSLVEIITYTALKFDNIKTKYILSGIYDILVSI